MKAAVAGLALAAGLAGCAMRPMTPDTLSRLQFGAPPVSHTQNVPIMVKANLLDPESAIITVGEPAKVVSRNFISGKVRWLGYLVRAEVRARNSFGGYADPQIWGIWYLDDRVVHMSVEGPGGFPVEFIN